MTTLDTLITGGTVVTSDSMFDATIGISDGTIASIGREWALPPAERTVDVDGQLVLPGVVDPHTHLAGYNSIDSYETGTAAAATGGVTSLITFAWQGWEDGSWNETETLGEAVKRHRSWADPLVDYSLHPTITRETPDVLAELPDLAEAGLTSVKLFTTDDIRLSHGFIAKVFDRLADTGGVGMVHTEDYLVCQHRADAVASEPDGQAPTAYPRSRPDYAEAIAAGAIARLAAAADAKYYGAHTTSAAAADAIAAQRTDGSTIRAETCTHYTALDRSIYEERGNLAIMAPPLREPDDVDALFGHLEDGALSVVSTDHVALPSERKADGPWWESAFGINSLQTSLPVFHDVAVNERGLSYPKLVELMCRTPAETFGLPAKGRLEPGADADLVVFDPDETYTVSAERNHSNADYSVYDGREVTGRVSQTYVRGTLVADEGEIVAEPGHGQFLAREIPDWSG